MSEREVERLRAENERLRAALLAIARGDWNKDRHGRLTVNGFAREALEPPVGSQS